MSLDYWIDSTTLSMDNSYGNNDQNLIYIGIACNKLFAKFISINDSDKDPN